MGVVIAAVLAELLLILLPALAGGIIFMDHTILLYLGTETASPILNISSPSDTLQYLSQLESVARKLKDQLIRQNQVIVLEKTGLIITCLVFNQRKCKQKWLNPHCWCPSHIFHPLQLQKFVNCTKLLSLEVPSISVPKAPSISVIQPNLPTYSWS